MDRQGLTNWPNEKLAPDWHGLALDWHGLAWIGTDWPGLANWRICVGTKIDPQLAQNWHGLAWIGMDWHGLARIGKLDNLCAKEKLAPD